MKIVLFLAAFLVVSISAGVQPVQDVLYPRPTECSDIREPNYGLDQKCPELCKVTCGYGSCCIKLLHEKPGQPMWPVNPPKITRSNPFCSKCCCDLSGFAHCNNGYLSTLNYYC